MRPPEHDPPRWSDETASASGSEGPDRGAIGTAFRREPAPALDDTALARIGRTVMASAQPRGRAWFFGLRAAILAVAVLLATGGVVMAGRLLWSPRPASPPQRLIVAAHNSVSLTGRHHRRLTLAGPATLTLEPGDPGRAADLSLDSGALTVDAGGEALSVRAGELTVLVGAGAAGEIRTAGDGNLPTVRALSGQLRLHREGSADVTVSPSVVAAAAAAVAADVAAAATTEDVAPLPLAAPAVIATNAEPTTAVPTPPVTSHRAEGGTSSSRPTPVPIAPAPVFKPAPPAPPRATPAEATMLARAFRKLRGDQDAAGALNALDDYERLYPSGWLRSEATLARAETMLALGRPADALPLLEGTTAVGGTLTRNARVARGELLAKADRCARAVDDFSDVLLTDQTDALAERALSGRAACRLRLGHADEARADLQRYLTQFPQGPRADEARRLLGEKRQ